MKKYIVLVLALVRVFSVSGQQPLAGTVIYDRKVDWIKLITTASWLSKEEKDRESQIWKNDSDFKRNMVLKFKNNKSHYTHENEMQSNEDGTYSWKNDDFTILRDFDANTLLEIQETLQKKYIIEDSLKAPNWKIHNEIKEVAGYICMKASTYDSLKKFRIEAWFTTDITISAGPELYYGLPGLILEINVQDGIVQLTATSVKLDDKIEIPALPKKLKGKRINLVTFNNLIKEHLKQQESMHQFPWSLRY